MLRKRFSCINRTAGDDAGPGGSLVSPFRVFGPLRCMKQTVVDKVPFKPNPMISQAIQRHQSRVPKRLSPGFFMVWGVPCDLRHHRQFVLFHCNGDIWARTAKVCPLCLARACKTSFTLQVLQFLYATCACPCNNVCDA
eukprot:4998089-Amphidinium_carterae.1